MVKVSKLANVKNGKILAQMFEMCFPFLEIQFDLILRENSPFLCICMHGPLHKQDPFVFGNSMKTHLFSKIGFHMAKYILLK